MPKLLPYSLALLDDVDGPFPMRNLDLWWLKTNPMSVLCADQIICPKMFCTPDQAFEVEVGYSKTAEVLSETFSYAWNEFVRAGLVVPLPISTEIREACLLAKYAVQNRIRQTIDGHHQLTMSASVNVNPSDPSRLLLFEGEHYCHNHLDSYAMHLVLSKAFDAIWMPDPRGHQMLKWFLSGKYNSDLSAVDASRAVLAEVSSLRIPTVDFIPHVGDCSRCEERESHCYSQIMTAEKWICESKVRVSILLDLWASKEVCSLRRLLNEIRYNVVAEPSPSSEAAVRKAKEAMTEAAAIATKRMKVTLKNIDTATDIATLFSGPMAILGATSGNSMLSVLGASVSSGAMTVTAACKLILNERYRWIRLRELNVNDDHSIRDWLAGL